MSAENHGGAAFPVPLNPGETYQGHAPADGMTLRDYFAAKAMAAAIVGSMADGSHLGEGAYVTFAAFAYDMSDAMLEERTK